MRELVYYVASSADGFIADPDGDFSAFPNDPATLTALFALYPETCPTHLRAALAVDAEPRRFDTVIMGYRTYEPALAAGMAGGAYPHLQQVVATHRSLAKSEGLVTVAGNISDYLARLKAQPGRDIWLCGGANLAAQLFDDIDEIQLKVNPVVLGAGIPVLPLTAGPRRLRLTSARELPGEVVLLTYRLH